MTIVESRQRRAAGSSSHPNDASIEDRCSSESSRRPSQSPDELPQRFTLERLRSIRIDRSSHWLVKNLVPARGLQVIYGPAGCGKSFVALDLALHIAAGRPWAGCRVRQGGVVYVAAEGAVGFRKRVVAAVEHLGVGADAPFALVTVAPDLGRSADDADALIAAIERQTGDFLARPAMIVLDTLARTMVGADESSSTCMGAFIDNAGRIGDRLEVLVLPVHHSGKDVERGMRGSSALKGAADCVWEIQSQPARSIRLEKMKDGPDGGQIGFELRTVSCGPDEDGDLITTCVIVKTQFLQAGAAEAATAAEPRGTPQSRLLDVLARAIAAHGASVPAAASAPAGARGILRTALTLTRDDLGIRTTTKKSLRSSLDRMLRELADSGAVGRYGGWIWLVDAIHQTR